MAASFCIYVGERAEKMHYKETKGILSAKNGMNLYRGCSHGCIYCDSRSKCYQMDHDFEDIEIKSNAEKRTDGLKRFKELFNPTTSFIVGDGGISTQDFLYMDLTKLF